MSAYYDLYQTPNPSPEDGEEKLLHARILPKVWGTERNVY